jgi:hypothetical protein
MATLNIEAIDDFVEAVQNKFKEGKWKDISLPLQKYHFASRLYNKARKNEIGGPRCEWKLRVRNPGNFKFTGLYAPDTSNRVNVLTNGKLEWAMSTVNYTYDLRESVFASGAKQIIQYVEQHEHGLYNDYFAAMEDAMFGAGPATPTEDPRPPCSLLWWIQPNATEGFNGGDITAWTAVGMGGIDSDTYPRWKNRTASYAAFDRDDAIEKIINSMDKCDFQPPVPYKELAGGEPQWELLTTHSRLAAARKLLQLGNDNIGGDLAAHSGQVLIRSVPLTWLPTWTNSDSANVRTDGLVLGVNWATFEYYFREGWSMKKQPAYQDKDSHAVRWRVMDDMGQVVCYDRRANFRIYSTVTITESD